MVGLQDYCYLAQNFYLGLWQRRKQLRLVPEELLHQVHQMVRLLPQSYQFAK